MENLEAKRQNRNKQQKNRKKTTTDSTKEFQAKCGLWHNRQKWFLCVMDVWCCSCVFWSNAIINNCVLSFRFSSIRLCDVTYALRQESRFMIFAIQHTSHTFTEVFVCCSRYVYILSFLLPIFFCSIFYVLGAQQLSRKYVSLLN